MSAAAACSVKAVLRVRPRLPDEQTLSRVIQQEGSRVTVPNPRNDQQSLSYAFDNCYAETAGQQQVFDESLSPLLDNVLQGYNATVFAYGNTGAGKTFTMQGTPADPGMIQRSVSSLIDRLHEKQSRFQTRWSLKMSYLEIYNERVYDLMAANPAATDLPLREDAQRNILIPGLSEVPIKSVADFLEGFSKGTLNRSMAATKLNSMSSRSHACLTLVLEQRPPIGAALRSKLHLIDLAGSEDNRRTQNQGDRLVESGAINTSLFVLGQVVDALNKAAPRVPYRDCKLTRLLQDSLGGRAFALVITNVAPTANWLAETVASLNFAAKSRNISNHVVLGLLDEQPPAPAGPKKPAQRKRTRSEPKSEDDDSVYELSEPPSSVRAARTAIISPPETSRVVKGRAKTNPFVEAAHPAHSALERQIEEKVAARLREISKGTILSPLLKARTGDFSLAGLAKTIKRSSSLLKTASGTENADPNAPKAPRSKSKRQAVEDMKALEEMAGILNMFPTAEPDLLHVLNRGSVQQLKRLKECGQSRAEQITQGRHAGPIAQLADLVEREVMSAKVLLKMVYANAMDADGLASLAHNVTTPT